MGPPQVRGRGRAGGWRGPFRLPEETPSVRPMTDAPAAVPRPRLDLPALAMGVAFAAMWASAFTSARIIVASAPPLHALSLRFLLSGVLALAIARMMGEGWRLTRGQLTATVVFGIAQNAFYLGFNFVAMQTVEASLAAIVASTLPLLVAVVMLLRGERLAPVGAAGLAAGFLGVAIVMGSRITQGVDPVGLGFCVAGVIALTVATLMVSGATSGGNVLTVVGYQMLIASAALFVVARLTEVLAVEPSTSLLIAFAYTLVVPGLLATWVWFLLVRRIGPTRAAVYHFLTPPLGVAVAWAILGERLGLADLLGVAVIAAGILMVQLARGR